MTNFRTDQFSDSCNFGTDSAQLAKFYQDIDQTSVVQYTTFDSLQACVLHVRAAIVEPSENRSFQPKRSEFECRSEEQQELDKLLHSVL